MLIVKTVESYSKLLNRFVFEKKTIGFCPTMGALHEGHLSLIRNSKEQTDITICSIFVNPTQFDQKSDLAKYPITIERDIALLESEGCDVLFLPDVNEIYPNGAEEYIIDVSLDGVELLLEGAERLGHFEGVIQVVERLLDIIKPQKLFMGLKDFQQQLIIGKFIKKKELPIELIPCKIVRESDGLAMSSRNARLTEMERKAGLKLSKSLNFIKQNKSSKTPKEWQKWAKECFQDEIYKLEYLQIVNPDTLLSVEFLNEEKALVLIACWVGRIRLIDNIII